MQASLPLRHFPIQAFVVALLAAAVLILGVAGGYLLRIATAPTTTTVTVAPATGPIHSASAPANLRGSSQGLFGSTNNGASVNAMPDESGHQLGGARNATVQDPWEHRARNLD